MENVKIKETLLNLYETKLDFTVIQTGKESKRVNGLYKPDTHEILLHNKNFKTDNELLYTAIHEYAHHLLTEESINTYGDDSLPNAKAHPRAFWVKFNELIILAEEKNIYTLDISKSPKLVELTQKIKKEYLEKNGRLMKEFGTLLMQAFDLCEEADIRYEDYIDRILCLPRTAAQDIARIGASSVNTAIGFENMKMVASIKKAEDRREAENKILQGESPVAVRHAFTKKVEAASPKEKFEKEKARIERTILHLQKRLEFVEKKLESLS